jgi:hypothetical protein
MKTRSKRIGTPAASCKMSDRTTSHSHPRTKTSINLETKHSEGCCKIKHPKTKCIQCTKLLKDAKPRRQSARLKFKQTSAKSNRKIILNDSESCGKIHSLFFCCQNNASAVEVCTHLSDKIKIGCPQLRSQGAPVIKALTILFVFVY